MVDSTHTFNDNYQLITLGSTRQLVVGGVSDGQMNLTATLFGGIQYVMDSTAIAKAIHEEPDLSISDGQLSFSYLNRAAPERGRSWDYLPATATEVNRIEEIIKANKGQVTPLQGYSATEESFKQLGQSGPSPRIIHLATHGYFYPDPENQFAGAGAIQYTGAGAGAGGFDLGAGF